MNDIRPCNLCGENKNLQPLYTKNSSLIVKCGSCQLVYVNACPTEEELSKIYSKDFYNQGSKYKGGQNSPTFLNAKNRLHKVLNLPGIELDHWLDVGCASGEFIYQAKTFVKDAQGIELSKFAAQQAESLYGVSVLNVDFINADLKADYYDVITAWDFIAHVKDPLLTFNKFFNLIRPEGYLILSTGDVSSLSSRLSGKSWHLMIPPKHLYYFSKDTIKKYLEIAGFEQIKITYPKKYVPLDFIIWKIFSQSNPKLYGQALSMIQSLKLEKLVMSINLYDIMEIYARKPRPNK